MILYFGIVGCLDIKHGERKHRDTGRAVLVAHVPGKMTHECVTPNQLLMAVAAGEGGRSTRLLSIVMPEWHL